MNNEEHILTDLDFESLGLHPTLTASLTSAGFTRLTPIQALTLPQALAGKDVAGEAQTGTGKTAAFLVALMQRLLSTSAKAERRTQDPRAVILAPTRELAVQIHKDAVSLSSQTGLRLGLVTASARKVPARICDITPGVDAKLDLAQHVNILRIAGGDIAQFEQRGGLAHGCSLRLSVSSRLGTASPSGVSPR